MGLVDIPEFRAFQQLAGAAGVHLLVVGLLQQRPGVLRHLVQNQEPLAGHLFAEVHQRGVHLLRGHPGKVGVQQVTQLRQRLRLNGQRRPHQLALHPAVRQHHHGDKAGGVHADQLKPLYRGRCAVVRYSVGGIAHKAGHHLSRLVDDLLHLLQGLCQRRIDAGLLLCRQSLAVHQLVDVQPVAPGRWNAPRRGVGLLQVAHVRQIRQLVPHGGGADLFRHQRHDGLGAHRFSGVDVAVHHDLQYLFFSLGQFHRSILRLALAIFEC